MTPRIAARLGGIVLAAAVLAGGPTGSASASSVPAPAPVVPAPAPVVPAVLVPGSATPTTAPLRVMPLGDSITWGSGSADSRIGNRTGAPTTSGYRIDLGTRLATAGLDVDFVGSRRGGPAGADRDNEGHPGRRIDQLAAHVDDWLATYRPDVVLLHAGTNDIAQHRDPAATAARLSALIDRIRAARPDAAVFVQQIVQAHHEPDRSRIAAYDALIPGVVAAKDSRVHLVDQSMIGGLALFDDLHPNDFGYARMAHNLYEAMRTVYDPAGTWPVSTDPFTATTARLCFRVDETTGVPARWHAECSTWTLRAAPAPVAG
ncbi:SGNH/GDSL hydrolase family protein [Paractinoplanes abujensis]|uniref:Lysophospholipase L1-like esterase n=1 Tax=Paractinoplanes abujensis TaxID=882441 RepID=A0A7W7FZE8_9ACTN|nr:SGNH/GDSL hydrolase family protein [Actinoplanes abujensis]MBB4691988.1 lysophospholipase L1-like esterase [Actinoplanes abujensis]